MNMDRSTDGTQPVEAQDATQQLPASEPQDTPPAPQVAQAPAPPSAGSGQGTPEGPRGPNAGAVLLAVVALAVAVLAILRETTDLSVNWSAVGPGAVIGAGVLLLLIGVVGLAQRERRSH